eukprot:s1783_g9.t1
MPCFDASDSAQAFLWIRHFLGGYPKILNRNQQLCERGVGNDCDDDLEEDVRWGCFDINPSDLEGDPQSEYKPEMHGMMTHLDRDVFMSSYPGPSYASIPHVHQSCMLASQNNGGGDNTDPSWLYRDVHDACDDEISCLQQSEILNVSAQPPTWIRHAIEHAGVSESVCYAHREKHKHQALAVSSQSGPDHLSRSLHGGNTVRIDPYSWNSCDEMLVEGDTREFEPQFDDGASRIVSADKDRVIQDTQRSHGSFSWIGNRSTESLDVPDSGWMWNRGGHAEISNVRASHSFIAPNLDEDEHQNCEFEAKPSDSPRADSDASVHSGSMACDLTCTYTSKDKMFGTNSWVKTANVNENNQPIQTKSKPKHVRFDMNLEVYLLQDEHVIQHTFSVDDAPDVLRRFWHIDGQIAKRSWDESNNDPLLGVKELMVR